MHVHSAALRLPPQNAYVISERPCHARHVGSIYVECTAAGTCGHKITRARAAQSSVRAAGGSRGLALRSRLPCLDAVVPGRAALTWCRVAHASVHCWARSNGSAWRSRHGTPSPRCAAQLFSVPVRFSPPSPRWWRALEGMGAAHGSPLPLIHENVPVNHDWVAVQTTSNKRCACQPSAGGRGPQGPSLATDERLRRV